MGDVGGMDVQDMNLILAQQYLKRGSCPVDIRSAAQDHGAPPDVMEGRSHRIMVV